MKKILLSASLMLCAVFSAAGQSTSVQEKDYESFKTVNVADKFVIKLKHSSKYSVKVTSDERISSYVQVYVKNGTLYLILDEKNYTPELKKELKQKDAPAPVLEAEVSMPTISSLILKDKAILSHCDEFNADSFTLTSCDNTKISQFRLVCNTAEFKFSKNAEVSAAVNVSRKLYVSASNSADVSLSQTGGAMSLESGGSCVIKAVADVAEAELNVSGGSSVTVSGKSPVLQVKASGPSRTDLEQLEVKDGKVEQCGSSKCHVNVTGNLKVDLTGGCMLTYKRKPSIEVERIVSSTLIKADDDPKRK